MAAATRDRNTRRTFGVNGAIPVIASDIIYKGTLVTKDSTGYAQPALNESGELFHGVALEQADNSSGAAGDISVEVAREGVYYFSAASSIFSQGSVGLPVFASDDQTIQLLPTNVFVGHVAEYVSGTEVGVDIGSGIRSIEKAFSTTHPLVTLTGDGRTDQIGILNASSGRSYLLTAGSVCAQVVGATSGSYTLALEKYDDSASGDVNLLTGTFDLSGQTAQQRDQLTLTATAADLLVENADGVHATVTMGTTQSTAGEGVEITLHWLPVF